MATAEAELIVGKNADHVVLRDVQWDTYRRLLRDMERQNVRLTYDRGSLEIMSPSNLREDFKERFGSLFRILAEEISLPFRWGGSTTLRRKKKRRGLEPDQCYWIASVAKLAGQQVIDLAKDPPPDLVIEIDITSSSLDRLAIYAAFGVTEVWRYDGASLVALRLESSKSYRVVERSVAFPNFPLSQIENIIALPHGPSDLDFLRECRRIVRASIADSV